MAKKVENERIEDFNSFHSYIPCITEYGQEEQFQDAYTITKFKEFHEFIGKFCCHKASSEESDNFIQYEIQEDVTFGEAHRCVTFTVFFLNKTPTKQVVTVECLSLGEFFVSASNYGVHRKENRSST